MNNSYENVKRTLTVEVPPLTNGLYIIRVQGVNKALSAKYAIE
jgi:hypothetical protein